MTPGDAVGAPGVDVATTQGTARVRVLPKAHGTTGRGTLLLGHGAGGQRDSPDVLALTSLADEGWTVVLVDQPWRVAGRRVATRPPSLDSAWRDVTDSIADEDWQARHRIPLPRPWVFGGRSAGARVACRTSVHADGDGAAAVVCLAFPLHPPGRPDRSRAGELALPLDAAVPTLVVQGAADPFGTPPEIVEATRGRAGHLTLATVPGNHSASRDLDAVRRHVGNFLAALP